MQVIFVLASCLAICFTNAAISNPSKYETSGGFLPSSRRYYSEPENHTITVSDSQLIASERSESKLNKDDDRIQRFGVSGAGGYGGSAAGYPQSGTGISTYAPMKIDIGGVILGTLIGLGAILVIPKIAHIFSGGYRRSVDGEGDSSITEILSKIDKALEDHHIDSSVCMQRIVCTYVQESQKNIATGKSGAFDDFIESVTSNSMMSFLLDGTAIQQAIKLGKTNDAESCTTLYSKCPISRENVMQVISSLLPN